MEATIIIKLSDGSEKVIELQNASINTNWYSSAPTPTPPSSIQNGELIGNITLQGQIKNSSLIGSV